MTKETIHYFTEWNSLNYMYGVVNISFQQDDKLLALLEFEPGLYKNHQLKAIRNEYLKLPGILFAWVEGHQATEESKIVLGFDKYVDLYNYKDWNLLNTKFFAEVIFHL